MINFNDSPISNINNSSLKNNNNNEKNFFRSNSKFTENSKCEICLGILSNKFVLDCGDFYCKNCIKNFILDCVYNVIKFNKMNCPSCGESISENSIKKLLEKKDYEKYFEIKKKFLVLENKELIPCSFPDCLDYANENEIIYKNILKCNSGHYFCKKCLKYFDNKINTRINTNNNIFEEEKILTNSNHKNNNVIDQNLYFHNCKETNSIDLPSLNYLNNNINIRKCPNCNSYVFRDNIPCNNVTCQNILCNYEFCWICMNKYENNHYTNPFSMCFGLERSDQKSKFANYKSIRALKCVGIFFLLICVIFPICVIFFSGILLGSFVGIFILDGRLKKIKFRNVKIHKIFKIIYYMFYGVLSLGLLPFGYIIEGILIVSLPPLLIINHFRKNRDNDEDEYD